MLFMTCAVCTCPKFKQHSQESSLNHLRPLSIFWVRIISIASQFTKRDILISTDKSFSSIQLSQRFTHTSVILEASHKLSTVFSTDCSSIVCWPPLIIAYKEAIPPVWLTHSSTGFGWWKLRCDPMYGRLMVVSLVFLLKMHPGCELKCGSQCQRIFTIWKTQRPNYFKSKNISETKRQLASQAYNHTESFVPKKSIHQVIQSDLLILYLEVT